MSTAASCRLCHGPLFAEPLIELQRMPKAAQYYPLQEEFQGDCGITLRVDRCVHCGLVQLAGDPVPYYKEVITAASLSPKAREARLRQMQTFATAHELQGKTILELGSGDGSMLDVMEEAGMIATGLEASVTSVQTGQGRDRKMICGYLCDLDLLPDAPYEAFISLNFLEHVPQPDLMIQQIYRNTTANAFGFVTVPNLEYLLASRCFYEFVADHVCYFTMQTLRFAFEKNGFEVLECHTIHNDNDILAILRKRPLLTLADQYHDVEELIRELRQIVSRYRARHSKVAVWGAGHRTLALLALANLMEIECVIDSAPFKQGRFTPVLHKTIMPPDYIRTADLGLVIVMVPGLYPEEVLNTIKNMGLLLDVAALRGNRIEFLYTSEK